MELFAVILVIQSLTTPAIILSAYGSGYTSHGIKLTILLFAKGVFILKNPIGLKSHSTGRQFWGRIYLFVYVEVKEAGMG